MNRKRVLLAAMLGLLALCLAYAYFTTPRLEKAPPRVARDSARQDAAVDGKRPARVAEGRLRFDFLSVEPEAFTGAKRDIFRFAVRRPLPRPPVIETPVPEVVEEPPPITVEEVQKALSQFTFLGFLEKDGEKTVFLSSSGSLFLVKSGERFGVEREFLVSGIDAKRLQVRRDGREDLIEIPLIEKHKLAASVSDPVSIPREAVAPSPAENGRVLRPQRRTLRPVAPEDGGALLEGQQPLELIEEVNPEEGQAPDEPVKGDLVEGEGNVTNQ